MANEKLASSDLMHTLHQMVAQQLISDLETGEATPQQVANAMKFLKDNEIVMTMAQMPQMKQVENAAKEPVAALPFDEPDDDDENESF